MSGAPQILSASELADHFAYLDTLRETGETNMFGAAPYLTRDQGIDIFTARAVLSMWMNSARDATPEERAQAAINKAEGR